MPMVRGGDGVTITSTFRSAITPTTRLRAWKSIHAASRLRIDAVLRGIVVW